MRKLGSLVAVLALAAVGLVAGPVGAASPQGAKSVGPQRSAITPGMALKRSVTAQQATAAQARETRSELECSVAGGTRNTKLDCDDPFPNNEPDVEVNPQNPRHMVASSNDYGSCCDQFYTTFNGGHTWVTGNMSKEGPRRTGSDPVTTFDARTGHVLHASLNYILTNKHGACDGDLVVSISRNGGRAWASPVVVSDGKNCDDSAFQLFNDKEFMVTDNNPSSPHYGRTYLTWSAFVARNGNYVSSAIYEAHSDNGGMSWTKPRVISGHSAALCTFQEAGPRGVCDENQFSVPTVGPDGNVYVAFENEQNKSLFESPAEIDNQYLVVKSTNGGATWSAPHFAAGLEDGANDYPVNVDGRQTLSGYQLRVNSAGNIVAGPDGRLYIVFSDNRAGRHDVARPVTNTNVYVVTSRGGATWSKPRVVGGGRSDQWFPWADVNPVTGELGVVYHSRSHNPRFYDTMLATGIPGSFTHSSVSTRPSHPRNSVFFQAGAKNCQKCATFHGDYIGLSYGSDGKANVAWTDMRDFYTKSQGGPGYAQFTYFARR